MQLATTDQELFFVPSRLVVDSGDGPPDKGTGFLLKTKKHLYLITAGHLLEGASSLTVYLPRRATNATGVETPLKVVMDVDADKVMFHPTGDVDLAAVPFDAAAAELGTSPGVLAWPIRLVSSKNMESLLGIEEVIFVGYPMGWQEHTLTPLARRATLATPLAFDYADRAEFLVDGVVFPGSSGSPVFLLDREGRYADGAGAVLVGIISGLVMTTVKDASRDREAMVGLGIACRASALRGFVFDEAEGITS